MRSNITSAFNSKGKLRSQPGVDNSNLLSQNLFKTLCGCCVAHVSFVTHTNSPVQVRGTQNTEEFACQKGSAPVIATLGFLLAIEHHHTHCRAWH